jgi:hypothetical protein
MEVTWMAILTRAAIMNVFGRQFSASTAASKLSESTKAFQGTASYDIFLSHSYSDAPLIEASKRMLESAGFSVYVDWIEDPELDRDDVTADNARRLKERMNTCASLLFVATDNSSESVWMPWELGYVDGTKGKVAILPILQEVFAEEEYYGQEYLGIYPYVSRKSTPTSRGWEFIVHETDTSRVRLESWIANSSSSRSNPNSFLFK